MASRVVALVPAAGQGVRMGSPVPKQFMLLGGQSLFLHCLRVLDSAPAISGIILAVPAPDREHCLTDLGARRIVRKLLKVVAGGIQRQDSVRLALEAAGHDVDLAVVHDAVRPFVTVDMIDRVVQRARETGAAIVAVPARDTVKLAGSEGMVEQTLDRQRLWLAQTPQAFRADLLRQVHLKAHAEGVRATDDAQLMERYGYPVAIVEGSWENIKVTRPEDLTIGEAILASRQRGSRHT